MSHRTIAIVAVLFLACGCATNKLATSGAPAPPFSLPSLDGAEVNLSQFRSKVVLIDFWATWCPPCREGLPHLQSLSSDADMARRGLQVLAVDEEEQPAAIREFLNQAHYTFAVARDANGSAARGYGLSSLPTTVIVGRDGLVQAVIRGCTPDTSRQIDEAVAHALAAPAQ